MDTDFAVGVVRWFGRKGWVPLTSVTCVILCAAHAVGASGPKKSTLNKSAYNAALAAKVETIELEATTIDRLGTNPISLYAKVAIPNKREFETVTEYDARVARAPEGPFAIRIETDPTYDTTESAFMVKPKTLSVDADLPRGGHVADHDVYRIAQTVLPPSTYVGQNAFGVKKVITKATLGGYYLRSLKDTPYNLAVIFTIDRDRAIEMKRHLRLYAICRVPHGYVLPPIDGANGPNSIFHSEPTITEPQDLTEFQFVIDAEITQLWLVDERTGVVLTKAPYANAAD
jgi:hypothetical protein